MTVDIIGPLLIGFLGSFHCLGMCGPLVLAYSLNFSPKGNGSLGTASREGWKSGLSHHTAYHAGRLLSYGLLGALAGGAVYGAAFAPMLKSFRSVATILAGSLIVLCGLWFMRFIPLPISLRAPGSGTHTLARLISSNHPVSKWLLGMGAGFLPCMLPWAVLLSAASSGNPWRGFVIMVLFGLGTVPVLFLTGISASLLSLRLRIFGEHLAGVSIVIMGIILLWKGAKHFI